MKYPIYLLVSIALIISSCKTSQTGKTTQTGKTAMNKTFDRNVMPQPGPAPKVKIGKPKSFSLNNGMKVLVVENHKLPRVSVRLTLDNPPLREGDRKGMSTLLGRMLGTGTKKHSKDEFNEKIDFTGAYINYHSGGASMKSLSKFFPEIFSLMAEGITQPVFSQNEFNKQKDKLKEEIKNNEKNANAIAWRVEDYLVFGEGHPYGEFTTAETLDKVSLSDIKQLYQFRYRPDNAYLVIIGDVDFENVKEMTKNLFENWQKANIQEVTLPAIQNPAEPEIDFIDLPSASQSVVNIVAGMPFRMDNPDYHAVLVANQIFGGDFNSHLNMNLREEHGYTYGARSSLRPDKYIAKFRAGAQVRHEVLDSAVVQIMKELNRIRTEKVSAEELATVKASFSGEFVRNIEKPETVARYALNIEKYNLPDDFYKTFLEKINAVTADDVLRVAQKYFYESPRIVIVSNGAEVIPALEKTGYPIRYFDTYGKPAQKPKVKQAVSSGITVSGIIDKYLNARGGKEKLSAVKSILTIEEMGMRGMAYQTTTKREIPNKISVVTQVMGQTAFKMVFDGTDGYMEQMGNKMPVPEEKLNELKEQKYLFEALNPGYLKDFSVEGIVPVNGKDAYKITGMKGENKTSYYFDTENGLLVKEEVTAKNPMNGEEIIVPTSFADYREVDGIMFPFKKTSKAMGEDVEIIVKEIKINPGFDDATFK